MDNHGRRPEVIDALEEGKGISLRYSQTLQETLRYVAVPARGGGRTLGVVRAAVPLAAIDSVLGGISTHILVASLLVAVLLAAVTLIVARRVVKPLEELSHECPVVRPRRSGAPSFRRQQRRDRRPGRDAQQAGRRLERETRHGRAPAERARRDPQQHGRGRAGHRRRRTRAQHERGRARLLGTDPSRAAGRLLAEIVRNSELQRLVAGVLSRQQPVEGEVVLRDREPRSLYVHGTVFRERRAAAPARCWYFTTLAI